MEVKTENCLKKFKRKSIVYTQNDQINNCHCHSEEKKGKKITILFSFLSFWHCFGKWSLQQQQNCQPKKHFVVCRFLVDKIFRSSIFWIEYLAKTFFIHQVITNWKKEIRSFGKSSKQNKTSLLMANMTPIFFLLLDLIFDLYYKFNR